MIWIQILILLMILYIFSINLVAKGENKIVLWPEYFDNSLSKKEGRRVSRKLAISAPTVEDIAKAAKKLKLNPKIERNKAYPGRWWQKTGRVLVRRALNKNQVIKRIAIVLKKSKGTSIKSK